MLNGEPVYSIFHDNAIYKPLIKEFTKNLPTRTSELEQAVESEDLESIKFFAHRIKGAAASYGYPKLTSLAADIEEKARSLAGASDQASGLNDISELLEAIKRHSDCILKATMD